MSSPLSSAQFGLPEGYEPALAKSTRYRSAVAVTHGDAVVGSLQWVHAREVSGSTQRPDGSFQEEIIKRPPMVVDLKVNQEHRRKGLATAMWNHARSIEPDLHHDDIQTPDGEAWVKRVGGPR